ncbi:MAG TPA: HepT-like ribonuclease domain-containing protein [Tepidisphaeraceae bacterium]|nr:HepT-like ribonuclease domain-containing protein [Tepidisphaeraceae bacterium]
MQDAALPLDMLESARRVLTYCAGRSRADFDADLMFADAVVRRVEIVGEAARGVSDQGRSDHPEIGWHPIMATRHILAHEYATVNYDIVWRIVTDHMPRLVTQLEGILAQAPPPPPP